MKRLILTATLALGLVAPAMARASLPQPIYFWGSVAATIKAPGQPSAPEVIRPSTIAIFADGSWVVEKLHWTGWGSNVAHATGISSASNGIPNQAQGKRKLTPAKVTLSDPGPFAGHEVYRCFALTVPPPATSEKLCLTHSGGFYYLGAATPSQPRTVDFLARSIGGGCEMSALRVTCETYSPTAQTVTLNARGVVRICTQRGTAGNGCRLGNFGEHTPAFGIGRQVTVGRFRCRVLRPGVQCVVTATGKGFQVSRTSAIRIG